MVLRPWVGLVAGVLLGEELGEPFLALADEVVAGDVVPLRPLVVQADAVGEGVVDDAGHRCIDLREFDVLVAGECYDVALGQIEGGLLPFALVAALGGGGGEGFDEPLDILREVGLLGRLSLGLEFRCLDGLGFLYELLLLDVALTSLLLRASERRGDGVGSGSDGGHGAPFESSRRCGPRLVRSLINAL